MRELSAACNQTLQLLTSIYFRLDSIGIACFSHNFGQLDGENSDVAVAFNSLGGDDGHIFWAFIYLLSPYFPFLATLPTRTNRVMRKLRQSLTNISAELIERTCKERQGGVEEKSIVGLLSNSLAPLCSLSNAHPLLLLVKDENAKTDSSLTHEEVIAQMNVLLLAGYETTSISLTVRRSFHLSSMAHDIPPCSGHLSSSPAFPNSNENFVMRFSRNSRPPTQPGTNL